MLTFPTHLFNPLTIRLQPRATVIEGGENLLGERDVLRTDGGGYWVADMVGIELLTPDLIRAWEAWEGHLQGGMTRVLVPVPSLRQAPRPAGGPGLMRPAALVAESDDPYFPEAKAFASPLIVAASIGAAALRATQLDIAISRGARLRGGERFAIDHPAVGRRVYKVARVLARDGLEATCVITPPLREAIGDGTALDFDWPSMVATLVPNSEISPELMGDRHATVNIAFREAMAIGA